MRFNIAEHIIEIAFAGEVDACSKRVLAIAPSLRPFVVNEKDGEERKLLFRLTIYGQPSTINCQQSTVNSQLSFREIGDFDTGNGHTKVEKDDATGSYRFTIRNIEEKEVCLLYADKGFSDCGCRFVKGNSPANISYGLNSALMLCYAFAGAARHTLLVHASCVQQGDYAYAFIAKSGTGKSTQVSNWLRHIPGCELLNDDNPVIRIIDGESFVYGSPWSGKTPCYRNRKARLGAITRIDRATENSCEKLSPVEAFASLLPSCSTMKWESRLYNDVMDTITEIIQTTGVYTLHCLPNKEAAIVCHDRIKV